MGKGGWVPDPAPCQPGSLGQDISILRSPSVLSCTEEGSQPPVGFKVQGKNDKAPDSRAYQAQRQRPLYSPSSFYGGRNKKVQMHKDPGLERSRGCVGLGPPREAEHMQISAPWCSLVSRTFSPGFLPTFQITLSVSYWFLSIPHPRHDPCTPSLSVHFYFQIRISPTLVTDDVTF